MATVILFDIDGTLLTAQGAGRRAMEAGFSEVTGRPLASFRFAGMTDPAIAREALQQAGLPPDDARIAEVIAAYLERLPAQLQAQPPRVLPGVPALLEALRDRPGVAVGVGTGNVEAGARAKLRAVGLDATFAFGGFGSDDEQRARLLRVGAQRGMAHLGIEGPIGRVLVVGDTPRDVAAAEAIGADCLAVATSHYDEVALRATGPSAVVSDLTAPAARAWFEARVQ